MLEIFRWLEPLIDVGGEDDKLPRVIPYVILPVGRALRFLRLVQATIAIACGHRDSLIVSHDAEDAVDDVARMNREG